ncbi:5-deoxy-glucuronate isomerase [Garciella nitratireducens]|uniref:5-deoxy-glucuronate isomerase n=1 Tax=Garciella nitratireducens DSM 15102 TaxID=1121911 RepID=A0A1T4LN15_9FIRM|nr:5-deoxy-glucuronate isomerase [Garciella nitratireducens]SJZ56129.1 5-deoxy-glucuronate isomerase [Garciella nitratireducens DSM 15102]
MSNLLRKPKCRTLSPGVTLFQDINSSNAPVEYVGLKQLKMEKGSVYQEELEKEEVCIVALTGKITVTDYDQIFENIGRRENIFDRTPTDSVYISNDRRFKITAISNAKVILCYAPSKKQLPTKLIKASENSIESRGKYANKRYVQNILTDTDSTANSLLVVEVYTEGGNWSSYPPHKHDRDNLPEESFLEEIYYHEMNPKQGFVFQRVYTDDRSIDETMTVENEEAVLVPKGYHPVAVPDGYTSYYLNVMAGPIKIWKFYNEPAHEWILNRK